MLVLYEYPSSGNSYKVRLACSLVGKPLRTKTVDITIGESRRPWFLNKNPVGKVPVLIDEEGQVRTESNAIVTWLLQGSPYAENLEGGRLARMVQWLCFEQNELDPVIGTIRYHIVSCGNDEYRDTQDYKKKYLSALTALGVLEDHLKKSLFLLGDDPSLVDICLYGYAHLAPDIGLALNQWPHLEAWCKRIEGLPGYINIDDRVSDLQTVSEYHHVGVRVKNIDSALDFYKFIGFEKQVFIDNAWEVETRNGLVLNLIANGDQPRGVNILHDVKEKHPGITHVAFCVDNLDVMLDRCRSAGIDITEGPKELPGRRYFFIRDPDQNVVEINEVLDQ